MALKAFNRQFTAFYERVNNSNNNNNNDNNNNNNNNEFFYKFICFVFAKLMTVKAVTTQLAVFIMH